MDALAGSARQGRLSKAPGNHKEEGALENDPPKVVYELLGSPLRYTNVDVTPSSRPKTLKIELRDRAKAREETAQC